MFELIPLDCLYLACYSFWLFYPLQVKEWQLGIEYIYTSIIMSM